MNMTRLHKSDVKVRADKIMEVFGNDDCDLDVETYICVQIIESLVDNNAVKVRADEFLKIFAEDKDVKDNDSRECTCV